MSKVKFKVTEVLDFVKQGSKVAPGIKLKGELDASKKRIYYTDRAKCEWVFYVGVTCELISYV